MPSNDGRMSQKFFIGRHWCSKITFVCNRTLLDLILAVLNFRGPTHFLKNGNNNEIEGQS
jgi:hypothetical protein